MPDFDRYFKTISPEHKDKKVESIDFTIVMENASGTMWVTDMMVQDGAILTGWSHNTKEILQPVSNSQHYFYNVIVRGQRALMVPNKGDTMGYVNWTLTADTDIPTPPSVENEYRSQFALEFGMMYRTRNIRIYGPISKNDEFKFWSKPMTIQKNGASYYNYNGFFLGAPAGDMYYLVSIPGEQIPWDSFSDERITPDTRDDKGDLKYPGLSPRTDKRVRVLLEVIPRWLAEGGKHL
ncbi:hypothetical protein [Weizmannia phage Youna2]